MNHASTAARLALTFAASALMLAASWRLVAPTTAQADTDDALRRSDVTYIVKALEAQARATHELADATREAARKCGR